MPLVGIAHEEVDQVTGLVQPQVEQLVIHGSLVDALVHVKLVHEMTPALVRLLFANSGHWPLITLLLSNGFLAALLPQELNFFVLKFVFWHIRDLYDGPGILNETLDTIEAHLDLLEAVSLHQLRLDHVQDRERYAKQDLGALQEKQVPDTRYHNKREVVREEAAHPLERGVAWIVELFVQVCP